MRGIADTGGTRTTRILPPANWLSDAHKQLTCADFHHIARTLPDDALDIPGVRVPGQGPDEVLSFLLSAQEGRAQQERKPLAHCALSSLPTRMRETVKQASGKMDALIREYLDSPPGSIPFTPLTFLMVDFGPWGAVHAILDLCQYLREFGIACSISYVSQKRMSGGEDMGALAAQKGVPLFRFKSTKGWTDEGPERWNWGKHRGGVVYTHWSTGIYGIQLFSREDVQATLIPFAFYQDFEGMFLTENEETRLLPVTWPPYIEIPNRLYVSQWIREKTERILNMNPGVPQDTAIQLRTVGFSRVYEMLKSMGGYTRKGRLRIPERDKKQESNYWVPPLLYPPMLPPWFNERNRDKNKVLAMYRPSTSHRGPELLLRIVRDPRVAHLEFLLCGEIPVDKDNYPNVRWLGWLPRKDMHEMLAGVGTFLETSVFHGFGLTSLEALMAGARVVSTDNKGSENFTGTPGFLVGPEHTFEDEIALFGLRTVPEPSALLLGREQDTVTALVNLLLLPVTDNVGIPDNVIGAWAGLPEHLLSVIRGDTLNDERSIQVGDSDGGAATATGWIVRALR